MCRCSGRVYQHDLKKIEDRTDVAREIWKVTLLSEHTSYVLFLIKSTASTWWTWKIRIVDWLIDSINVTTGSIIYFWVLDSSRRLSRSRNKIQRFLIPNIHPLRPSSTFLAFLPSCYLLSVRSSLFFLLISWTSFLIKWPKPSQSRLLNVFVQSIQFQVMSFLHIGPCILLSICLSRHCREYSLFHWWSILVYMRPSQILTTFSYSIAGVANLRLASHMRLFEGLFVALDICSRVPFSYLCYYIFKNQYRSVNLK
jgi:hypothetical protein